MTFEQIKLEIAKRLGDDEVMKTRAVAGRAFEQAVTELALSDETRLEEIPDIIVNEDDVGGLHNLPITNLTAELEYPSDMVKFIDVYMKPSLSVMWSLGESFFNLTLKEISWEEANRSKLEQAFRPAGQECFWYRTNTKAYFMVSQSWYNDAPVSKIIGVVMNYIKNPDMTDWTTDKNLINDLGYSRNFIYKCMTKAVQTLSNNQNQPSGK